MMFIVPKLWLNSGLNAEYFKKYYTLLFSTSLKSFILTNILENAWFFPL